MHLLGCVYSWVVEGGVQQAVWAECVQPVWCCGRPEMLSLGSLSLGPIGSLLRAVGQPGQLDRGERGTEWPG